MDSFKLEMISLCANYTIKNKHQHYDQTHKLLPHNSHLHKPEYEIQISHLDKIKNVDPLDIEKVDICLFF